MNVISAIAGADAAERMRRFPFLVILAAALYAGYLYVPAAHASYGTVTVNDHRGLYNGAFIGAATAILSSSFMSLFGFFFIRGSVQRDWELHVDGIVGASRVSRFSFLAGKWLSNLAVLSVVAAITYLAAFGMQEWHGEDRAIDVAAYALPYLLITVPALAFVSALAVLLDVIPLLRGILGGVLYVMVIWMAMLVVPFQLHSNHPERQVALDPLGARIVVAGLYTSERAAFPQQKDRLDVSIGGTPAPKGGFKTYRYDGIAWTPSLIAERFLWIVASLLIVLAASTIFDGFRREVSRAGKTARSIDIIRFIPDIPPLRALRAEFSLLVNGASVWWLIGAAGLAVLTATLPAKALDVVLPIALIWPLERISMLGARERQFDVFDILSATPGFTWRNLLVQWSAGTLLSSSIVLGYLLRLIASGDSAGALAVVMMIGAMVAIALALGAITGAPRAFQASFLILWYLGPVEHVPGLDVAVLAQQHALVATVAASAIAALALALGAVQRVVENA